MTTAEALPVTWNMADNGVAVVTIDRPRRRNALNLEVKRLLTTAVLALDADPAVRVIVLTLEATDQVFATLRGCRTLLIAAVEGYALGGGCELALACDLIVAAEGARFGQPEIKVGIMPGAGGTQRLLRTIGKYQALRMMLTGEPIAAADAFACGLVSELCADGDALAKALALAENIAAMPPLAVRAILEVVQQGQDAPLDTALLLERKAFQVLFDSQDQKEGMRAFLEKRPAQYQGR
jgi:enoyl-CoA hydratase